MTGRELSGVVEVVPVCPSCGGRTLADKTEPEHVEGERITYRYCPNKSCKWRGKSTRLLSNAAQVYRR